MFEPKVYKKNGLEAFRLVGSDGSEFFYEGAIDCEEKELYKDPLGRLYYPIIAEIGGAVKYYVELDPQVPALPFAGQDPRENAISRLVNASPRPEMSLPEDIFVRPEASQDVPPEVPEEIPQAVPLETLPVEPGPAEQPPEPATEIPVPAPLEYVKSEEAVSAIHAVFSPKVDILHPSVEPVEKVPVTETQKEEEASPAKAPARVAKKRSLKWPIAIAVIVIVLIAASAVGVYLVKPGAYDGLRSMFKGPVPSPVPTAAPTEAPTPSPSPSPTPVPDEGAPSAGISELIDSDSPLVAGFFQARVNETSAGDPLRQTCDLFSYVNDQWNYSGSYTTPRKASEIAATLEGTSRDYTILMTALMQSQGIESRLVYSYTDGSKTPRYYPEVLAANTSAGYEAARQQLNLWYGVASPQGHSDDIGYWIALTMGSFPGIRPSDATTEYALFRGTISLLR